MKSRGRSIFYLCSLALLGGYVRRCPCRNKAWRPHLSEETRGALKQNNETDLPRRRCQRWCTTFWNDRSCRTYKYGTCSGRVLSFDRVLDGAIDPLFFPPSTVLEVCHDSRPYVVLGKMLGKRHRSTCCRCHQRKQYFGANHDCSMVVKPSCYGCEFCQVLDEMPRRLPPTPTHLCFRVLFDGL